MPPEEEPVLPPEEEPVLPPEEESDIAPAIPSEAWNMPLDVSSDPMLIQAVQTRLTEWGWLQPDTYVAGTLDAATSMAILAFQEYYNINFMGTLIVISPEYMVVEPATLVLLMNSDGVTYPNPNAVLP